MTPEERERIVESWRLGFDAGGRTTCPEVLECLQAGLSPDSRGRLHFLFNESVDIVLPAAATSSSSSGAGSPRRICVFGSPWTPAYKGPFGGDQHFTHPGSRGNKEALTDTAYWKALWSRLESAAEVSDRPVLLLSHGPPLGRLDTISGYDRKRREHVGDFHLMEQLKRMVGVPI